MNQLKRLSLLPLLLLLLTWASFTAANLKSSASATYTITNTAESAVYICSSPKAYAYHKTKTCRGLNRCAYEVKEISQTDATARYKRSACKVCY